MNAERVSAEAMLAMRRIAVFIANMISAGGCASVGFAEAGALVPPTSVGGAPLVPLWRGRRGRHKDARRFYFFDIRPEDDILHFSKRISYIFNHFFETFSKKPLY